MQKAISGMHGKKGFEWLPGGATLGNFAHMVAVLESITQMLPGTRIEDVLTTVVARTLGMRTVVLENVIHANRCPQNKKRAQEQIGRWLAGAEGIKNITGENLAGIVIDPTLWRIILYPLLELAKGEITTHDVIHLIKGLVPYLRVKTDINPDDFEKGNATW